MYPTLKYRLAMLWWHAKQPPKIVWSVITACFWTCIPRKWMGEDHPWQRRGIRYIQHTSAAHGQRVLHAIQFNQGAGYVGGATLYIGRDCHRYVNGARRQVKFVIGLTNNGNYGVFPGRY
jgi:hypothetical protein